MAKNYLTIVIINNYLGIRKTTVKWTHVGQYKPYGDTFRVAEVHCKQELSKEEILRYVEHDGTPSKQEYEALPNKTAADYFRGWYTIEKMPYGYKYTKQEPYTD